MKGDFDHEWDIKDKNGMNVSENRIYQAMLKIGLDPKPQYKISKMTVDFAFPNKKIAIEINGPHHNEEPQKTIDKKRYFELTRRGWRRKSYTAKDAFYHPNDLARRIYRLVKGRTYGTPPKKKPGKGHKTSPKGRPTKRHKKNKLTIAHFVLVCIVFLILVTMIDKKDFSQNQPVLSHQSSQDQQDVNTIPSSELSPLLVDVYNKLEVGMNTTETKRIFFDSSIGIPFEQVRTGSDKWVIGMRLMPGQLHIEFDEPPGKVVGISPVGTDLWGLTDAKILSVRLRNQEGEFVASKT